MMARFGRSLSSEWRKVTATKTWWILALVFLGYAAMMAAPFAFLYGEIAGQGTGAAALTDTAALTVYSTTATFGYVIPLVFGALAATNELRHGTLGVTFAIEPRRGIVLAGKAAALAIVGAILALAGLFGAVGAGVPVLAYNDVPTLLAEGGTWGLFLRVAVAIAMWAIIGFGVGLIVKNQAFAIVLAIGFTQFIEPVLRIGAQAWEWSATLGKFLPGAAMDSFVGASALNDMAATDPSMPEMNASLGMGAGFGVLAAYAVVSCAIGWVLRLRADVD
ncbi:MAG TPA: ABC transporter permease subunit [Beutenbergiaceae bacterium]|nr:ABC transporter permease subunit [Beutenbergiaceae bacterium]